MHLGLIVWNFNQTHNVCNKKSRIFPLVESSTISFVYYIPIVMVLMVIILFSHTDLIKINLFYLLNYSVSEFNPEKNKLIQCTQCNLGYRKLFFVWFNCYFSTQYFQQTSKVETDANWDIQRLQFHVHKWTYLYCVRSSVLNEA